MPSRKSNFRKTGPSILKKNQPPTLLDQMKKRSVTKITKPKHDHVVMPLTRDLCQKGVRNQYARNLNKCNIDHTDPANAKCYHNAHHKASKAWKACEKLPKW